MEYDLPRRVGSPMVGIMGASDLGADDRYPMMFRGKGKRRHCRKSFAMFK